MATAGTHTGSLFRKQQETDFHPADVWLRRKNWIWMSVKPGNRTGAAPEEAPFNCTRAERPRRRPCDRPAASLGGRVHHDVTGIQPDAFFSSTA